MKSLILALLLPIALFARGGDFENASLDSLNSDYGSGLLQTVPYFTIDEYNGHTTAALATVGPAPISLTPRYKMPTRYITNPTAYSRAAAFGSMGEDWHFGPGFLLVKNFARREGDPGCYTQVRWQEVAHVSPSGSVKNYYRDLLFTSVQNGAVAGGNGQNSYGPDYKQTLCSPYYMWVPSREDIHFIAEDLSRITKDTEGFYWMMSPDGSKTKFAPAPYVYHWAADPIDDFHYWVPVEFYFPNKRKITYEYQDFRNDPPVVGQVPSWYIKKVIDHANERHLEVSYEPFTIEGVQFNTGDNRVVTKVELFEGSAATPFRTLVKYEYNLFSRAGTDQLRLWKQHIPTDNNQFYTTKIDYEDMEIVENAPTITALLAHKITNPSGAWVELDFLRDSEFAMENFPPDDPRASQMIVDAGFLPKTCRVRGEDGDNDCFDEIVFRRNHVRIGSAKLFNADQSLEQDLVFTYSLKDTFEEFGGYQGGDETIPDNRQNFLQVDVKLLDGDGLALEESQTVYAFPNQSLAFLPPPGGSKTGANKTTPDQVSPSRLIGNPLFRESVRKRPVLAMGQPGTYEESRIREEWVYQELVSNSAGPENLRIGGGRNTGFLRQPLKTKYHRVKDPVAFVQGDNLWQVYEYRYDWPEDWRTGQGAHLNFNFDLLAESRTYFKNIPTSGSPVISNITSRTTQYLSHIVTKGAGNQPTPDGSGFPVGSPVVFDQMADHPFVLGLNTQGRETLLDPSGAPIQTLQKITYEYFSDGPWQYSPLVKRKRTFFNSNESLNWIYEYHSPEMANFQDHNLGLLFRKAVVGPNVTSFTEDVKRSEILDYRFGVEALVDTPPLGSPDGVNEVYPDGQTWRTVLDGITTISMFDTAGRIQQVAVGSDHPLVHEYATPAQMAVGNSFHRQFQEDGAWLEVKYDDWEREIEARNKVSDTMDTDPQLNFYNPLGLVKTVNRLGAASYISRDVMDRDVEVLVQNAAGQTVRYTKTEFAAEIDFDASHLANQQEIVSVSRTTQRIEPSQTSGQLVKEAKTDLLGRVIYASTNKDSSNQNFTEMAYRFENDEVVATIKPYGTSNVQQHRMTRKDWLGRTLSGDHPELTAPGGGAGLVTEYDDRGLVEVSRSPLHETSFEYDYRDRLSATYDADGILTEMKYRDDIDVVTHSINHLGATTINENFDAMNRPQTVKVQIPMPIEAPYNLSPAGDVDPGMVPYFTWTPPWTKPGVNVTTYDAAIFLDGEKVWEEMGIQRPNVLIPWDLLAREQEYEWRVRAWTDQFEPSLWGKAVFRGTVAGDTVWAKRIDEHFPHYKKGDVVRLEVKSNRPNAVVYVWRDKDGVPQIQGEPLPVANNTTDANGDLVVSFTIGGENGEIDITAFCGEYTKEVFAVGSPDGPKSDPIDPYHISCEQVLWPGIPEFVQTVRNGSCTNNFGDVVIGEDGFAKIWMVNTYSHNGDGSYVDFADVNISFSGTDDDDFTLLGFKDKNDRPVAGMYYNERCYAEVQFSPTAIGPKTALIQMTYAAAAPDQTSQSNADSCAMEGWGIDDVQPVMIWGSFNGPNHPNPTRNPPLPATDTFDIGKYVPGDMRDFWVYNPHPCSTGYPCPDDHPFFRGRVSVWDYAGWKHSWGPEGTALAPPDYPYQVPFDGRVPCTYDEWQLMGPESGQYFTLENLEASPGDLDNDTVLINTWRMVAPYDDFSNDIYTGPLVYKIKAHVVDEPYIYVTEGGDPITFPTVPLGEKTFASITVLKNIAWDILPRATGSGDFSAIVEQPLETASGSARTLSGWYEEFERVIPFEFHKTGKLTGEICLEETSGYFQDGRFGQICLQAQAYGTPRLEISSDVIDLGDIDVGEEAYAEFTIRNATWTQRLNGTLVFEGSLHPFEFVQGLPEPPKPGKPSISPQGYNAIDFDGLTSTNPGHVQSPTGIQKVYVRFKPVTAGDFEQVVEVSLCTTPSATPEYQCEPIEGETIRFWVRGRGIDSGNPQYRNVNRIEEGSFGMVYNDLGQVTELTPPHLGAKHIQYNRMGAEAIVEYESDQPRQVIKNKDYRIRNSAGVNKITGSPSLVRMQSSYSRSKDITRTYDDLGRLTSSLLHEVLDPDAKVHETSGIAYDARNNITGYHLKAGAIDRDLHFDYTSLGQLSRYGLDNGEGIDYGYDAFGNMTSRNATLTDAGSGFNFPPSMPARTYSSQNQVDGWDYDAEGRIRNDGLEYHYDALGRLALVTDAAGELVAHYLYDATGMRVRKLINGKVTYYYRLGTTVIEEKTIDFESGDETVKNYLHHAGQAVMTTTGEKAQGASAFTETEHEYHYYDHLGSAVANWTTANNPVIQTYSPFGMPFLDHAEPQTTLGYAGHENDPETDQTYMKARYYIPELGRFNRPDPAADFDIGNPASFNLYQYVHNNPINLTDPMGLQSEGTSNEPSSKETYEENRKKSAKRLRAEARARAWLINGIVAGMSWRNIQAFHSDFKINIVSTEAAKAGVQSKNNENHQKESAANEASENVPYAGKTLKKALESENYKVAMNDVEIIWTKTPVDLLYRDGKETRSWVLKIDKKTNTAWLARLEGGDLVPVAEGIYFDLESRESMFGVGEAFGKNWDNHNPYDLPLNNVTPEKQYPYGGFVLADSIFHKIESSFMISTPLGFLEAIGHQKRHRIPIKIVE